ncbi:MAG: hypothetical protein JXA18_17020 [Chitinispirillaceae bacterium]|nr:hypothetical protein [Chitinispirillaceae bacterium]
MKSSTPTIALVILAITGAASVYGVPPYLWYATHSIEYYYGNGCSVYLNLDSPHDEADGFHNAVVAKGIGNSWRRYNRRDTECTAARWTGTSAETNGVDFLFYAGHGCGTGPYLGCNSTYEITNWSDIRFGGNGYLKWVQAAACEWFVAEALDQCDSERDEYERWEDCFAGVHTVQGHRAVTYEYVQPDSMSREFWDRWVSQNNTIYYAWRQAQVHWVYEVGGNPGLQPATAAYNDTYAYELWSNADDDLAPSGMGWLGWATVGTPEY